MIGQVKIRNKISKLNLDNTPRSILIVGQRGSGKHSVATELAERLGIECKNITKCLTIDTINEIYSKSFPTLYLIELYNISLKEKNFLLKLVEEPLNNCYLVLLSESKEDIISTLKNRCVEWKMVPYSSSELRRFIPEDYSKEERDKILNICKTPGQVKETIGNDLTKVEELSNKIITQISRASFPNSLSISEKIAFKEEKDKINLDVFNRVFSYVLTEKYLRENFQRYRNFKEIFNDYLFKLKFSQTNKRNAFENMIIKLWKVSRLWILEN